MLTLELGQRVWWRVTGRGGQEATIRKGIVIFLGHLPKRWHFFPEKLPRMGWRIPADREALAMARRNRAKLRVGHGVVVRIDPVGADGRQRKPTFHAPHPQHLRLATHG